MDLRGVEIKKVNWTAGKYKGKELEEWVPPKLTLTLEIEDPPSVEVKQLLDFAEKRCVWRIEQLQAEMKLAGGSE